MLRSRVDISDFKLYHYTPSLAAAVIFIVQFSLTTSLHAYQMARTRTWFFIPFVVGGCFEMVGYIGRVISSQQTPNWALGPYIVQAILLLVSPALFAASIYMSLGRIVHMVEGDSMLVVRRIWLTKIFVVGDVLSFLMQGGGGGLMAGNSQSSINMGQDLVVGGLFVQILFFGAFVLAAGLFHVRMNRQPTQRSVRLLDETGVSWRKHMFTLYAASALSLVRSIFRVVEYLQGFNGYILDHEVFLYLFDATLMWLTMCLFNWWHPSEVKSALKGGPYLKGVRMKELGEHGEQEDDRESTELPIT